MSNFFIPTQSPEDWKSFLADPKHWKTGYSARSLAYCWQEARGFPEEVKKVFNESNFDVFKDIEILLGFPEYKVPLQGGLRASQNDIFILAKGASGLVAIAVEGKVAEHFGDTVAVWRLKRDEKTNKDKRLEFLLGLLKLQNKPIEQIRYQLLHRTASAIIEADRFNIKNALMLIHSFSQSYEHFEDYSDFLALFKLTARKDALAGPIDIDGINLYFGWVKGDKRFLAK